MVARGGVGAAVRQGTGQTKVSDLRQQTEHMERRPCKRIRLGMEGDVQIPCDGRVQVCLALAMQPQRSSGLALRRTFSALSCITG